jgi:hypothetical protein
MYELAALLTVHTLSSESCASHFDLAYFLLSRWLLYPAAVRNTPPPASFRLQIPRVTSWDSRGTDTVYLRDLRDVCFGVSNRCIPQAKRVGF